MSEESNFGRVWAKLKEMNEHLIRIEALLDSKVQPSSEPLPLKAQDITLSMLKDGDKNVTIKTHVSKIDAIKSGVRTAQDGSESQWRFQVLLVGDYTAQMPLQLWDKDIETYSWIGAGDEIVIKDAYVTSYKQKLQMRISKSGNIEPVEAHEL